MSEAGKRLVAQLLGAADGMEDAVGGRRRLVEDNAVQKLIAFFKPYRKETFRVVTLSFTIAFPGPFSIEFGIGVDLFNCNHELDSFEELDWFVVAALGADKVSYPDMNEDLGIDFGVSFFRGLSDVPGIMYSYSISNLRTFPLPDAGALFISHNPVCLMSLAMRQAIRGNGYCHPLFQKLPDWLCRFISTFWSELRGFAVSCNLYPRLKSNPLKSACSKFDFCSEEEQKPSPPTLTFSAGISIVCVKLNNWNQGGTAFLNWEDSYRRIQGCDGMEETPFGFDFDENRDQASNNVEFINNIVHWATSTDQSRCGQDSSVEDRLNSSYELGHITPLPRRCTSSPSPPIPPPPSSVGDSGDSSSTERRRRAQDQLDQPPTSTRPPAGGDQVTCSMPLPQLAAHGVWCETWNSFLATFATINIRDGLPELNVNQWSKEAESLMTDALGAVTPLTGWRRLQQETAGPQQQGAADTAVQRTFSFPSAAFSWATDGPQHNTLDIDVKPDGHDVSVAVGANAAPSGDDGGKRAASRDARGRALQQAAHPWELLRLRGTATNIKPLRLLGAVDQGIGLSDTLVIAHACLELRLFASGVGFTLSGEVRLDLNRFGVGSSTGVIRAGGAILAVGMRGTFVANMSVALPFFGRQVPSPLPLAVPRPHARTSRIAMSMSVKVRVLVLILAIVCCDRSACPACVRKRS